MTVIRGHFDGKVLVPDGPVDLPRNQPLVMVVELTNASEVGAGQAGGDFWQALEKRIGTVEAPPDWAAEHDHYLYGTPKRQG